MITLATGNTIQGKAGTASAITYTIFGLEISGTTETYKSLGQGVLGTGAAVLYTVPGSTQSLIKNILLANTTGSDVANVVLYVNGSAVGNQIVSLQIPAGGEAIWGPEGWKTFDGNGAMLAATSPPPLTAVTPTTIDPDDAGVVGTGLKAAHEDHQHAIVTDPAGAIAVGDAAAEGSAGSFARSDHKHSLAAPAAPANVTKAAAAAGSSANVAREDHKHDISTAVVGALGASALEGTSSSLARADHVHPYPTPAQIGGTPASRQVIAGAGLTGGGALTSDVTLDVNPDNSSLEINADILRVKANGVTNAMLAQMAASSFKGNNTGGAANAADLTTAQATALLDLATTALKGLMSLSDKIKINGAYKDIVADFGADPAGSVDATSIIQTAVDSFSSAGGRLYFPVGTYKMSGTVTISKPVIIFGAGRSISNITMTHATVDQFLMASGSQGAGFEQIRLTGATAGTRTAGAAVNFGTQPNVYMQQCDILFHWRGVQSSGALQFVDDMNIREGGANAANGAAVLVLSTGDRYIRRLTTDQGSNPTGYAGVRINQCSSCVVADCNIIHSTNAIDIVANAGVGTAIASVYAVNTFFDTSTIGGNITCSTGTDTVQRVTFVRCWFSTHATAGVIIGHANVNSIDFIGCEFYQSPYGIDAQACTEWAVRASRFAGCTTAGIRTTAGATHSFTISDNFIGNGAGFGANQLGINIQAGTYKRYQIMDNRGLDSNTVPGITDLGVVGATDQKYVGNNMGALVSGAIVSLVTPVATSGTGQTQLLSARIPANSVSIGQGFRVKLWGISSTTGTLTGRIAAGANGATTDNQVWITNTSPAQVANAHASIDGLLTVRTIGAPGSIIGDGDLLTSQAAAGTKVQTGIGAAATAAITTTAAWFIGVSVACSSGTFTAQGGMIYAI